jgi:hypothetical protein
MLNEPVLAVANDVSAIAADTAVQQEQLRCLALVDLLARRGSDIL